MKHKPIPKALRQKVYDKYNGHCAYCGCELAYNEMQVDHIDSIWHRYCDNKADIQDDTIDNLMPSCRQCNYYKGTSSIKGFRRKLNELNNRFLTQYNLQLKLAVKYGFIENKNWNNKFYFEDENIRRKDSDYERFHRGKNDTNKTQSEGKMEG